MAPLDSWSFVLPLAALCIPWTFALAAGLVSRAAPFRSAGVATTVAALIALMIGVGVGVGGAWGPVGDGSSLARAVRLDVVTSLMLGLVCALAVVIVRYSRTYLHGDPGQPRYARALLATLAAVTLLVVANNLLVIALAWTGTSFALHVLLTFHRERPQALIAAHKKFLVSRLADTCLVVAIALLWTTVGSVDLDVLHAWARTSGSLPAAAQAAAILIVLAVSLKSAQLPFHGWLTQVMEAPTPVSALLHAGVVNIGGFVMIRLAPFMTQAPAAQTLLVVIGTTTAVVAALVMTTRVSIKVTLAWSTCAQMGFMLVQCALGAWHLALLHLVAHSLYKAHAFLGSGSTVAGWRAQAIAPRREPLSLARSGGALVIVLGSMAVVAAAASTLVEGGGLADPTGVPLTIFLGLSLSPLVARGLGRGLGSPVGVAWRSLSIAALYFGWHAAFARLPVGPEPTALALGWIFVIGAFALLFALHTIMQARPHGRLARELQPRLFAGLYLDELFTRLTFRLWPPRRPTPTVERPVRRMTETLEARS